jgi:hypothetical protein
VLLVGGQAVICSSDKDCKAVEKKGSVCLSDSSWEPSTFFLLLAGNVSCCRDGSMPGVQKMDNDTPSFVWEREKSAATLCSC